MSSYFVGFFSLRLCCCCFRAQAPHISVDSIRTYRFIVFWYTLRMTSWSSHRKIENKQLNENCTCLLTHIECIVDRSGHCDFTMAQNTHNTEQCADLYLFSAERMESSLCNKFSCTHLTLFMITINNWQHNFEAYSRIERSKYRQIKQRNSSRISNKHKKK